MGGSGLTGTDRWSTTVAERAAGGDAAGRQALAEVGRWLGLGIGNLINVFNPELVVLGGLYQRLFSFVETAIMQAPGASPSRPRGGRSPSSAAASAPTPHC